jgi:hypothetical protein
MAHPEKKGKGSKPGRRKSRRRKELEYETEPRMGSRPMLIMGAIILVGAIVISAIFFMSLQPQIKEINCVEFTDASGDRGNDSAGPLMTMKITLRAYEKTEGFNLKEMKIRWEGPSKATELTMDPDNWGKASGTHFTVGAVEPTDKGWDPGSGKFLVKGKTIVWILIDLTDATGIGDPVGQAHTVEITFTAGDDSEKTVLFVAPGNFGTGRYISLDVKT